MYNSVFMSCFNGIAVSQTFKSSEKFLLAAQCSVLDIFSYGPVFMSVYSPLHSFFYLYCREERLMCSGVLKGWLTTCLSVIFKAGPSQYTPYRRRKSKIPFLKEFDSEQMLWHM